MKRNHFIVGLILLIFFVISFLTNIMGPLVPDILRTAGGEEHFFCLYLGHGQLFFGLASFLSPMVYSYVALNSIADYHESFSEILVTGIAGGAVLPLIVGALGDAFGLRVGMLFLYISLGYIMSIEDF